MEPKFYVVIDLFRPVSGSQVNGYRLPNYFSSVECWEENAAIDGESWSDQYMFDIADYIREEFNGVWEPSNLRFMSPEKYKESYSV